VRVARRIAARALPVTASDSHADGGADWAAVRLRVEGGTIVDADAAGLAEDLRGLTLLEAAAVGGETLPVDALGAGAVAERVVRVEVALDVVERAAEVVGLQ